jgi:hypothetical protein
MLRVCLHNPLAFPYILHYATKTRETCVPFYGSNNSFTVKLQILIQEKIYFVQAWGFYEQTEYPCNRRRQPTN